MDRHELDKMFDGLVPDPRRERELLRQLLQDNARRNNPMKNWKRAITGVAAAALLVTAATAAVVPGLSRKLLDYLGIASEDTQAVELLIPGAMTVDITKEDNGATLHVTQVLRDRTSVMVLADFTAPEGTSLRLGSTNPRVTYASKGFSGDPEAFIFLDQNGERINGESYAGDWKILEDDDPLDNHLSALFVTSQGELFMEKAVSLRIPATTLGYYDLDEDGNFKFVEVYSGDWSVDVPLPKRDIGYAQQPGQIIGELNGVNVTLDEIYVSPMTLQLTVTRETAVDWDSWLSNDMASRQWSCLLSDCSKITLNTKDGAVVALQDKGGYTMGDPNMKMVTLRLAEITDPARFQGGGVTFDADGSTCTIPLDNLMPVEP